MIQKIKEFLDSPNREDKLLGFFMMRDISWKEAESLCNIESPGNNPYKIWYRYKNTLPVQEPCVIHKFNNFYTIFGCAGIGVSQELMLTEYYKEVIE